MQNEAIKKLEEYCNTHEHTTGKFTIGDELQFNPFMRLNDPQVIKGTGLNQPDEVMDKLRTMKNNM